MVWMNSSHVNGAIYFTIEQLYRKKCETCGEVQSSIFGIESASQLGTLLKILPINIRVKDYRTDKEIIEAYILYASENEPLKPCPFCGSDDIVSFTRLQWITKCCSCDCQTSEKATKESSRKAWNRRCL